MMPDESEPVNERSVLHDAITFSSHDSVLGHDTWSVNVRATIEKLHEAGYCIAPLSDNSGEIPLVCACGLEMSRNPHPNAGEFEHFIKVGATWVCIPCTIKVMRGWASRYHQASRDADRYAELLRASGIDPDAGLP